MFEFVFKASAVEYIEGTALRDGARTLTLPLTLKLTDGARTLRARDTRVRECLGGCCCAHGRLFLLAGAYERPEYAWRSRLGEGKAFRAIANGSLVLLVSKQPQVELSEERTAVRVRAIPR